MNRYKSRFILVTVCTAVTCGQSRPAPPTGDKRPANKIVTEEECTAAKLGTSIPQASIGVPVSSVVLNAPQWHAEGNGGPAFCGIDGLMLPVDKSSTARPIHFGVAMPASWSHRAAHLGGGGMNGSIPVLTGGPGRSRESYLTRGLATYGSDSGHQGGFGRGPGWPPDP